MTPAARILTTIAAHLKRYEPHAKWGEHDLRIHVTSTAYRLYDSKPTEVINEYVKAAVTAAPSGGDGTRLGYAQAIHRKFGGA